MSCCLGGGQEADGGALETRVPRRGRGEGGSAGKGSTEGAGRSIPEAARPRARPCPRLRQRPCRPFLPPSWALCPPRCPMARVELEDLALLPAVRPAVLRSLLTTPLECRRGVGGASEWAGPPEGGTYQRTGRPVGAPQWAWPCGGVRARAGPAQPRGCTSVRPCNSCTLVLRVPRAPSSFVFSSLYLLLSGDSTHAQFVPCGPAHPVPLPSALSPQPKPDSCLGSSWLIQARR